MLLSKYEDTDTAAVARVIEQVWKYLDYSLPEELLDFKVFDLQHVLADTEQTTIARLTVKYCKLIEKI